MASTIRAGMVMLGSAWWVSGSPGVPGRVDCRKGSNWGVELRLTNNSFDMLHAPVAGGYFLGDYMGLERAGNQVVPAFGIADGKNKTSIYTRRIIFSDKAEVASASDR